MEDTEGYVIDDIDKQILQILTEDPRMPYKSIANKLEEAGYEMSAEGVRHRVRNLFSETKLAFLTGPSSYDWEMLRIYISVTDEPGSLDAAFKEISDLNFWLVIRGIGMIDIQAVATISSLATAEELYTSVRNIEEVESVDFFLETGRISTIENYLRS